MKLYRVKVEVLLKTAWQHSHEVVKNVEPKKANQVIFETKAHRLLDVPRKENIFISVVVLGRVDMLSDL